MKIGFFMQDLKLGGAEIAHSRLVNEWHQLGHEVDLLFVRETGELMPRIKGPRIFGLGVHQTRHALFPLASKLRKYDILVSGLTHCNVSLLMAKIISGCETPVVIIEHSDMTRTGKSSPLMGVRIASLISPWIYSEAAAIVAVSNGVADSVRSFAGRALSHKIHVIENPIIQDNFYDLAHSEIASVELRNELNTAYIVAIGRLAPEKNFAHLLASFAKSQLRQTHKLVIVGDGPERKILEAQSHQLGLSQKTVFTGYLSNPLPILLRSKGLVLSSIREGLPTVIVEAMALSKRIVSTDCNFGPRELLNGVPLGMLCPVNDTDGLCRAIDDHFSDRANAADAAAPCDTTKYHVRQSAMRYIELFKLLRRQ